MAISVCRAVININGTLGNLLFRFAINNSRDVALFHRKRPLALHIDGCEAIRCDQHSICTTRRYRDRNNRARFALLVINVNNTAQGDRAGPSSNCNKLASQSCTSC